MAGGFSTTSAQRSTATSTVSSSVAVVNNPDGTGFAISGPALTSDKVITQIVYVEGANTSSGSSPVSGSGSGNGPVITGFSYLDSNNNVVIGETAVSTFGGNVLISGTNFVANSLVYLNNSLVSNTFLSSTQIQIQAPAAGSSNVAVMIFNPSNVGYISNTYIRYSGIPTWSTSALTFTNNQSSNNSLTAISDSALTYTLQAGSTLPTGLSLNSSGYISGTPTGYSNTTVVTVVVIATDSEGQSTQQTINISILTGDTSFNYTTLLAKTSGVNGANNSVFVDSSTNNFAITPFGSSTQGTFSPFSQTGWSNYFNGTTDYLTFGANQANLGLGTGDFTFEFWFNALTIPAGEIDFFESQTVNTFRILKRSGSSGLSYDWYGGTSYLIASDASITTNIWHHVAVSRISGNISVYYDGTRVINQSDTTNGVTPTSNYSIGGRATGLNYFNGYMSNVRLIKGTGIYSGTTITPPASPLTAITNTQLLIAQSNRFVDNSTNAYTLTVSGTPSIQSRSPFLSGLSW